MLGDILSEGHKLTIADMEAGLEHLSRSDGTLRHVDALLVVVEPYRKALETVRRTVRLAHQLGIPRIYGVGSKVRDDEDAERIAAFADEVGLTVLATVPFDEAVSVADREGLAVLDTAEDAPAVQAVGHLLDALEDALEAGPVPARG